VYNVHKTAVVVVVVLSQQKCGLGVELAMSTGRKTNSGVTVKLKCQTGDDERCCCWSASMFAHRLSTPRVSTLPVSTPRVSTPRVSSTARVSTASPACPRTRGSKSCSSLTTSLRPAIMLATLSLG